MRKTLLASVSAILLAACGGSGSDTPAGPPVTTQSVSTNTVAMTTPVVKQLAGSFGRIASNARIQDLLSQLGLGATATGTFQLRSGVAARQDAIASAPRRSGAIARAVNWLRQQATTPTPEDQAAQQFADFLQNKVFTEANLESSDSASATFLLKGAVVCADPAALPADVAACAQQLDDIQLRIRAIPHGDSAIDLEFMFGAERVKPLMLAITSMPSITVTVDLAAAKSTVSVLGAALGTPVQNLPSVMQGVVRATIKVEHEVRLTIDSGITQRIVIQVDGTTPPVSIDIAPVTSLAKLVADATTDTVELSGNLGAVAVTAPTEELIWSDAQQAYVSVTHTVNLTLGSASGSLLLMPPDNARATFDVKALEAKQDGSTVFAAATANPCTVDLAAGLADFTSPLDATVTALEADQLVTRHVTASGPFTVHEGTCDQLGTCTPDVFEAGTGASFALSVGGTAVLDVGAGQCFDLDTTSLVTCPAP